MPGEKKLVSSYDLKKWARWQFYLRRGLFNLEFLSYVGYLFWDKFADEYHKTPFQVAGLETGATPVTLGILMSAPAFECGDVNCFAIRQEKKKYGLLNRFEGIVKPDLPVLVVDDLCNTKGTIAQSFSILKQEKLEIFYKAFAIVYKDENDDIDKDAIDYIEHIFKFRDFVLEYDAYQMSKKFKLIS
jgi:orotate phosphoribosyltransferase